MIILFVGQVTVKAKIQRHQPDEVEHKTVTRKTRQTSITPLKTKALPKHRANIKEIMLSSNATPIRRFGDMGFVCCYCDDQYVEAAELKRHTLEFHQDIRNAFFLSKLGEDRFVVKLDITTLRCKICNRYIDTLEQFMDHLRIDHQRTIYTDIKNQIIPFKFVTDTLQCCICMNTFSKFKMLLEHMNIHYRNYICDICDVGFVNAVNLTNHMLTHENGTFKCDHCSQVFNTKNKKRLHERKHGFKTLIFKCGHCSATFNEYRKKEAHLALEHGQAYKCKACEKVFKNTKALNNHVRRNHLMERPHKCTECDMSFFMTTELNNHMVKHTGSRSFKCTICFKTFGRSSSLREHMKIHNDDRRFKCEHCGQSFVQKCSWRGHMRSKHDEIV